MFAPKIAKPQTKPAQRTLDAQAVRPSLRNPGGQEPATAGPANLSWHFGKIPVDPPERPRPVQAAPSQPGVIQRKLVVGAVDDPLEREADRVAEHVMSPPKEAEGLRKQYARPAGPQSAVREAPPAVHEVLRLPGQPLDAQARAYFEPRFGWSLDAVRVHTDDAAGRSAAAIGARAFTCGSHIVFATGKRPGANRLTAHELAHVAQNVSDGGPSVIRRSPDDAYEIISPVWNVSGRDVVIVQMKADGRTFFFYRRSGKGAKGQFEASAPQKDSWVPFEGFEEVEKLHGADYGSYAKFHKEPYYYSPDVKAERISAGYGTQTNQDIATWLDQKLPPGPKGQPTSWDVVQKEFDKYKARNLPYPGTEAPQPARATSGVVGGSPAPPAGGAAPAGETTAGTGVAAETGQEIGRASGAAARGAGISGLQDGS